MQVNITFRNMQSSDALKSHANEKVGKVLKYLDRATEAHVVLSLDRYLHQADITIHAGPFFLRGREKSEDMYASIDLAMDKIERQLRRYKEKLKSHKGRAHHNGLVDTLKVRYDVLELAGPEETEVENLGPRVIRTSEIDAKPMSVEEAVMQMDLMNNDFIIFTNAQNRGLNVVYRRGDGNYGLIEAARAAAGARVAEEA